MGLNFDIKDETLESLGKYGIGAFIAAALKPLGMLLWRAIKFSWKSYKENKDKEITMKWGNVYKLSIAAAVAFGILVAKAFL